MENLAVRLGGECPQGPTGQWHRSRVPRFTASFVTRVQLAGSFFSTTWLRSQRWQGWGISRFLGNLTLLLPLNGLFCQQGLSKLAIPPISSESAIFLKESSACASSHRVLVPTPVPAARDQCCVVLTAVVDFRVLQLGPFVDYFLSS